MCTEVTVRIGYRTLAGQQVERRSEESRSHSKGRVGGLQTPPVLRGGVEAVNQRNRRW